MSTTARQTNLLVQRDWTKIYQTFTNADFTSYDFETLRNSMINYIKAYYPETFNDFVESSEYGTKISHARKQLLDDAARSISQFFPSLRAAKDFLRSEAPAAGEPAKAGDARRAEAGRARYAESLRLLESAEKDLAKVAREFERDMAEALHGFRARISRSRGIHVEAL